MINSDNIFIKLGNIVINIPVANAISANHITKNIPKAVLTHLQFVNVYNTCKNNNNIVILITSKYKLLIIW
nr:MAG TPA: hypothetical protein [Caudoviricetes sp.]